MRPGRGCERKFDPPLNLKNIRRWACGSRATAWARSSRSGSTARGTSRFGALADRYITVDFTGRRFLTLVETESARWSDYVWNDGKWLYNAYRETIDFGAVESVSLLYNNLPQGKEVRCVVGPIKAMPMVPCTVKNPTITINGKTISFPVEIPSGGRLEFDGKQRLHALRLKGRDDCPSDCRRSSPFARERRQPSAVLMRSGERPESTREGDCHFTG